MSSAGQVGGAVSPASLFNLKVSSKPKPLGPSDPVNLKRKQTHSGILEDVLLFLCDTCMSIVKMTMIMIFKKGSFGGVHVSRVATLKWKQTMQNPAHKWSIVIFSTPMKTRIRLCVLTHGPCYLHTDHSVQN